MSSTWDYLDEAHAFEDDAAPDYDSRDSEGYAEQRRTFTRVIAAEDVEGAVEIVADWYELPRLGIEWNVRPIAARRDVDELSWYVVTVRGYGRECSHTVAAEGRCLACGASA